MGRHVQRHGWRHSTSALSFGFTVTCGWNGADLQTLEDESMLDLSTSHQLSSGLQLGFQVNNLTDEPLRMHRDNESNRIGRYDEYGRRYLLDVTLKF